jgi:hypothetical protein
MANGVIFLLPPGTCFGKWKDDALAINSHFLRLLAVNGKAPKSPETCQTLSYAAADF